MEGNLYQSSDNMMELRVHILEKYVDVTSQLSYSMIVFYKCKGIPFRVERLIMLMGHNCNNVNICSKTVGPLFLVVIYTKYRMFRAMT